jgi:hypothetical protein
MATVLSVVALVVALVAVAYAWKLQQELGQTTRRLDRYNRALFDANDELRRLREELGERTSALRVELMQRTGALRFVPTTTVREAEQMHPQAEQVLAGFHLGGCSSCAVEPDDTLAQVAAEKGVALDALLANLNLLVGAAPDGNGGSDGNSNGHSHDQGHGGNGRPGSPTLVKLPNVSLEF